MIKLFYILILISIFPSFGQNILTDSTSTNGKIINQLKKDGKIMLSLERLGCKKLIHGYRICNADSNINILDNTLTNEEITLLSSAENPTIKYVAFVLFCRRNNNKKIIVEKLKKIINEKFILMSDACEPNIATSLSSYQFLCLFEVEGICRFFKPKFKLTKNEIQPLRLKIDKQFEEYKTIECP